MSQVSDRSLLLVGKVIRPHGWGGLLRVWSYAGPQGSLLDQGIVFLKSISGRLEEHTVLSSKPHKKVFLIQLKGLRGRNDAEAYRGAEIFIKKEALSREQDEYFFHELEGLSVYLDTGEYVGRISQIISAKSNDTYVVSDGDKEMLVPAIYEVVKEIDLDHGKMIIAPMDGLLDLHEV
ncbi:MAG: 16S rRNA processing protein RimM [Deltaproteobacteria bacterium]|nr:16S rRNA processing protein RimM [Deltaproteobacteria bacterium]